MIARLVSDWTILLCVKRSLLASVAYELGDYSSSRSFVCDGFYEARSSRFREIKVAKMSIDDKITGGSNPGGGEIFRTSPDRP